MEKDEKSKTFFIIISISQLACGTIGWWGLWGSERGAIYGWEIWNAIIFIASAIVGFCASCSTTRCIRIPFIILTSIAAICPICILIYSIAYIDYYDQTRWDWGWELFTISLIQCVSTITAAGYTCCSRQNSSTPGMVLQPRV